MAALRENVPRNRIEYAMWDEAEVIPESSLGTNVPGKYRSTVSNILSKHCTEVKLLSEDMIQTSSHLSKKKLKDLITKQNNEIFSFMAHSAKVPESLGVAETIFRRYGRDIPSIKIQCSITDDLKLDATALNDTNRMELRVFANQAHGHVVLMARLDNLGKGASGAAVQNLRLMLGV
jgi:hypothetical protein